MREPEIVLVAAFETSPVLRIVAASDAECLRLGLWVADHREELHEALDDLILVAMAGECGSEGSAA